MKTYNVKKIDVNLLTINGKVDSPLWEQATLLKDFSSPWHHDDVKPIAFKALHDGQHLYMSYKVYDGTLHIDKTDNSKKSTDNSDRVELFLRSNEHLDPYYCLEIDPLGRVQDFIARPGRQFDFAWNWPKKEISIKSYITPSFFCVEIAISIGSLQQFGLIQTDGNIEAGLYRAKYNLQKNGQFEPTWITWVNPQTETPDFHTAASFGLLKLEDY